MVKLFTRVLAYNWRHYAAAVLVFVAFWQGFSAFSAVRVADDKLLTAMRQNAAYFEKAFLEGDVFETQRIISNLVNNSVEAFTGTGSVAVGLVAVDGKVTLEIRDDGKGIPPGILARLGQKGGTHGKVGGTGLGLYQARTSVESLGGG